MALEKICPMEISTLKCSEFCVEHKDLKVAPEVYLGMFFYSPHRLLKLYGLGGLVIWYLFKTPVQ